MVNLLHGLLLGNARSAATEPQEVCNDTRSLHCEAVCKFNADAKGATIRGSARGEFCISERDSRFGGVVEESVEDMLRSDRCVGRCCHTSLTGSPTESDHCAAADRLPPVQLKIHDVQCESGDVCHGSRCCGDKILACGTLNPYVCEHGDGKRVCRPSALHCTRLPGGSVIETCD